MRFVVYAAPRTGSNFLCSLLNSHPRILCHHGLFNPGGIHYALDHRDGDPDFGTVEERDRDPEQFLEKVWSYDGGKSAIGFKFNSGEHPAAAEAVARDAGVRKVLLRRRNRVKTYVSERIAEATGEWESYRNPVTPQPRNPATHKIIIDPNALQQHVTRNERYYTQIEQTLRETHQPWLDVHYESLPNGDVTAILAHLGLERDAPLTAGSVKRNPDDLRALVENYDELRAALAGTPLAADLER